MYLYLPGWLQVGSNDNKILHRPPKKILTKNIYLWYPNILSVFKVNYRALGSVTLTLQHCCHRFNSSLNFHWESYSKINAIEHLLRLMCHIRSNQKSLHTFFPFTSVDIWFSCWCVSPGHHWSLYPDLCVSIPSVRSPVVLSPSLPITWGHRF